MLEAVSEIREVGNGGSTTGLNRGNAYKDAKMIEDDYIVDEFKMSDYIKLFISPVLYLITIAFSFLHPYFAYIGFILLPVYNVIPGRCRIR